MDAKLTRQAAIEKAAKVYKLAILRKTPGMDDVALALNCEPTYQELKVAEAWYHIFDKLGFIIEVGAPK